MNYAQDPIWQSLKNPILRDLAGLLTAPPLWRTGCEIPVRELLGGNGFRLLLAWDSDPAFRLPPHLSRQRYALGHYAEDLLAYWFAHAPHSRLIAANVQIPSADGHSTSGELDFIAELSGSLYHIELACKYFGAADGAPANMVGLDKRDTLARKTATLHRQLARAGQPETRRMLAATGINADRLKSASIVRGTGFTASGVLPENPAYPPNAWSGTLVSSLHRLDADARYCLLPRTAYLSPARVAETEAKTRAELLSAAPQNGLYAQLAPQADGFWHETARFMLVQAETFAKPQI